MSFDVFRDIIKHPVHGTVYRLYYCPIRTPLNVGIKELKTDSDVEDFVRVGYENKWFVDLYVEHFDYDVMDFVNEEANGVLSDGSSDEYYSSDEIEEFDDVDFHIEGEEMDYLDELVPETEGEALDDPDDAHIDPIHKAKKGVTYPKHDPTIPWNKMTPVLGMRYEHPEQLKQALANYGVANGYQLRYARNDWRSLLVYCVRSVECGRCAGQVWVVQEVEQEEEEVVAEEEEEVVEEDPLLMDEDGIRQSMEDKYMEEEFMFEKMDLERKREEQQWEAMLDPLNDYRFPDQEESMDVESANVQPAEFEPANVSPVQSEPANVQPAQSSVEAVSVQPAPSVHASDNAAKKKGKKNTE
nr:splicing factor [Tanacetum cinerariifolium]